jgi:arabinogalactan oligomer/maltooligosaccharide transport system substrate-binding protein
MKKMKRFLSVFMIIAMVVTVVGCTKKEIPTENPEASAETDTTASNETTDDVTDDTTGESTEAKTEILPEEGAELTFWTGDAEFGKAVGEAFEQKYGVKVNVEEIGLDIISKMTLDGPSGNGADVFMAAHDNFATALDSGIIKELDPEIAATVTNDVRETAVKTVTKDGKVYGVPVSIETYALLYNKDLVTGEPATTFEQIMEEAKSYNNPDVNKFWYLTVPTDGYPAYCFLSLDGFYLFGADGTDNDHPGFDTPEFQKGLERIAALKELIPIKADDLKMETMSLLEQNFKDGKTAYYPIGPWLLKSLKEEGINYGVTTLPTFEGKQMKSFGAVQNAHVSAYTKYPKAAELFASYLVSEEGAAFLYSKANKITSRKDISNVEGLKDDAELKVYAEQFNNAIPMPSAKRISYYWTIMQSVLSSVFDGKMTPEEGAKKAQKDFDALVDSE